MNHQHFTNHAVLFQRLFTSLWIGVILLAACQANPPAEERLRRFVASSPGCVAPCWNNLIPGHSTVADLDTENVRHTSLHPIGERYSWDVTRAGDRPFADVYDGVIMTIGFRLGKDFTLGAIWAELGEPDSYEASIGIGGEIPLSLSLHLFYTNKGIAVNIYIAPFEKQLADIQLTCQVALADIENMQMSNAQIYFTVPGSVTDMGQFVPPVREYWEIYEWHGGTAFDLAYCG
jgi:hypothetical protein